MTEDADLLTEAANHGRTASVSSIKMHLGAAHMLGLAESELLAHAEIQPNELADPEDRISMTRAVRLIARIVERCPEPSYGLFLGEHFHPTKLSLVGYLLLNAASVGEGFKLHQKYQRVIGDAFLWTHRENANEVELSLQEVRIPEIAQTAQEWSVAGILNGARVMAEHRIIPMRAFFAHPEPTWRSVYDRIFECPITFEASHSGLVVQKEDWQRPVQFANPTMKANFEAMAEQCLKRLDDDVPLSRKVTDHLLRNMSGDPPPIEAMSKTLAMSARALQSALQQEGTTYQKLVGQVRQDLAENHLKDRSLSIAEVSFLVGFSEPSAFHRAFKRWTGRTPNAYRLALT